MGVRDTIDTNNAVIMLNGAKRVRLTLRALCVLEDIYGTVEAAFEALNALDDAQKFVGTMINFIYAIVGDMSRDEIESHLTEKNILDFFSKLKIALDKDLKDSEEDDDKAAEQYDWDRLYSVGRYHLLMDDDEFWNCTPRRFWKLCYLKGEEHGVKDDKPKKVLIDQVNW